jgi:hypothetical protein
MCRLRTGGEDCGTGARGQQTIRTSRTGSTSTVNQPSGRVSRQANRSSSKRVRRRTILNGLINKTRRQHGRNPVYGRYTIWRRSRRPCRRADATGRSACHKAAFLCGQWMATQPARSGGPAAPPSSRRRAIGVQAAGAEGGPDRLRRPPLQSRTPATCLRGGRDRRCFGRVRNAIRSGAWRHRATWPST